MTFSKSWEGRLHVGVALTIDLHVKADGGGGRGLAKFWKSMEGHLREEATIRRASTVLIYLHTFYLLTALFVKLLETY